jgi:hypothetical protein
MLLNILLYIFEVVSFLFERKEHVHVHKFMCHLCV